MTRKVLSLCAVAVFSAAGTIRAEQEFTIKRDIPYLPAAAYSNDFIDTFCRLHLRVPSNATNFATVVWFHGGGLVHGSRGSFYRTPGDDVASVSAGYRLMIDGKATPTDCVSDAGAVVAWTLKHIAEYGGDPKKVFVSGSSGGGYLTLMVGMDPKWLKPHGFSPLDLAGLFPQTGQASTHFNIRSVNGDKTPRYITKVDEWAPLAYASRDLPPMLIQTGENEIDIPCRAEENRLLYASLLALGHPDVQHCAYAGRRHGTMSMDVKYYEDDFIHRRIREIDGAAYSGGTNAVRACLERAYAGGLKADFVSLISSPAYELEATCAMKGHRTDRAGDGEWAAPLLEKVARLRLAAAGAGELPAPGTPLKAANKRDNFADEYEKAVFVQVTDPLGMARTKKADRHGRRIWITSAADLIRLAQMIAHGGEWHGRRILSAEDCAKNFPLPFSFGGRLFAEKDGSARVLFTLKDVASDPRFAALGEEWRALNR